MITPLMAECNIQEVNEGMKIPMCLVATDGRVFNIIDWKPCCELGEMVTVTAKMNVYLDKDVYFKDNPNDKPKL